MCWWWAYTWGLILRRVYFTPCLFTLYQAYHPSGAFVRLSLVWTRHGVGVDDYRFFVVATTPSTHIPTTTTAPGATHVPILPLHCTAHTILHIPFMAHTYHLLTFSPHNTHTAHCHHTHTRPDFHHTPLPAHILHTRTYLPPLP